MMGAKELIVNGMIDGAIRCFRSHQLSYANHEAGIWRLAIHRPGANGPSDGGRPVDFSREDAVTIASGNHRICAFGVNGDVSFSYAPGEDVDGAGCHLGRVQWIGAREFDANILDSTGGDTELEGPVILDELNEVLEGDAYLEPGHRSMIEEFVADFDSEDAPIFLYQQLGELFMDGVLDSELGRTPTHAQVFGWAAIRRLWELIQADERLDAIYREWSGALGKMARGE